MAGHMHAESLAVAADCKRKFYRIECETCKTETLFHGWKCTVCGALKVRQLPDGSFAPGWSVQRIQKRKKLYQQGRRDRSAAFKQQAEESRKKFEGGK